MRPFWIEADGTYAAINPAEIERVEGRGTVFTVYMRSGGRIDVSTGNLSVRTFIDEWTKALATVDDGGA